MGLLDTEQKDELISVLSSQGFLGSITGAMNSSQG